jgi:DNA-binding transcriptional regulator WhiA
VLSDGTLKAKINMAKQTYSILDPLLKKNNKHLISSLILDRLFYISHPSLSNLECSINLNVAVDNAFFDKMVNEILSLDNFNLEQIEKREKTLSVLFKGVAAMKLLNIIFKGQSDHALYPIYLKWIEGSE